MASLCAIKARYRLMRLALIIVLPFALAACMSEGGKDFSQTDLPPQQVATVTGHHLVIIKVDGVRNVPAFGTVVNRLTGEEKINTVRLPEGVHVIEVVYTSGPKEATVQPLRLKLSPYRDYSLDVQDGRVTFAEMFGTQTRNIPLYEKALSTSDGSVAPQPSIVINMMPRPPGSPAGTRPDFQITRSPSGGIVVTTSTPASVSTSASAWQVSGAPSGGATNYADWSKANGGN